MKRAALRDCLSAQRLLHRLRLSEPVAQEPVPESQPTLDPGPRVIVVSGRSLQRLSVYLPAPPVVTKAPAGTQCFDRAATKAAATAATFLKKQK